MIEIMTVGGYAEVGRNCTAVKVDDEVVILDLGLKMEEYVAYTEDEDFVNISGKKLIEHGAAPDISVLEGWKKNVKAIILGHAHLDHIGAVPYLANRFKAPIFSTPFTIAVLKSIIDDQKVMIKNLLVAKPVDSKFKVSKKISVEFINMTHSTPEAVSILLKTPYGNVLYANDFKMDYSPTIGKPINAEKLSQTKPEALIIDVLYADHDSKTPSENVARSMLFDLFNSSDFSGRVIFATTFSSHIARLKTIVEVAKKSNRKIVFLGRSLYKYITAAKEVGIGKVFENIQIVKYGSKIRNFLAGIPNPEKYVFVVTGHQGEPKATLSKIVGYFNFKPEDVVVFSCTTIPTPITIKNRAELEKKLKEKNLRIYKDIHVSGHGQKEDIRDFLKIVKPKRIITSHGEQRQMNSLKDLARELGYSDENILLAKNGESIKIGK